jgi:O-antigen/teichoic acid export membrane protein
MVSTPASTPTFREVRDPSPLLASEAADVHPLVHGNLRVWCAKSAYSLVDQGLTSLTGFCVNFLLARWMPAEVYGAYAIAFAAYLFVCGFHNIIILEPMTVMGPARHATRLSSYFRAQIAVHAALVGALSAGVALAGFVAWRFLPHNPLGGAFLGSALALPFLLFLWLTRRICYVLQRPYAAILGSGSCLSFVFLGLYVLRQFDRLSPFSAFLLVGGGSLLGSSLILRQLSRGASPANSPGHVHWQSVLRENWSYGRWLAGTAILYPLSGQVQMFLAGGFLGLSAAGVLRAMTLPAAVMTQVVSAADLLILPGFSYDFGRGALHRIRQKAALVSCVLGVSGLCFSALLYFLSSPMERSLFQGKFAPYAWLIPALSLIPAANGFNSGFSAALRGSQKPHFDLLANAIAAPVAVVSAIALIHWQGLAGAAISLVAGSTTLAFVNFCSYSYSARHSRKHEATALPSAISLGTEP